MPTFADEALVLDSRDYRERDQLVSLLTGAQGLQRGVFRKSRGGRAPRSAATQILSFVRFSAYLGPHAELVSFREIEIIRSSYPLASSFSSASAASVVAETLLVFCPVNEPAPRRFRLGVAILDALLGGLAPDTAVSYTQLWTLRLSGLLPSLATCSQCGLPLAAGGHWTADSEHLRCEACGTSGRLLSVNDLKAAIQLLKRPPSEVAEAPPVAVRDWLDAVVRSAAEMRLRALDFYRRHVGESVD